MIQRTALNSPNGHTNGRERAYDIAHGSVNAGDASDACEEGIKRIHLGPRAGRFWVGEPGGGSLIVPVWSRLHVTCPSVLH
jgi:hypothetical protein